jgi:hypothetical protein
MKELIHARDDDSLRNGSFILQRRLKYNSTYSVYLLGDFQRYTSILPSGLKVYTKTEARKLIKG